VSLLTAAAECEADEFACGPRSSRPCIPDAWRCDGGDDCGDGGDEREEMCGQFTAI